MGNFACNKNSEICDVNVCMVHFATVLASENTWRRMLNDWWVMRVNG